MNVDTSILCAIVFQEPERDTFYAQIRAARHATISAASVVECIAVLLRRRPQADAVRTVEALIKDLNLAIVSVDAEQAWIAADALSRYGRGRSPAKLNLGDSFAYAAAKATSQPLLFKGDDFSQTDIEPAL